MNTLICDAIRARRLIRFVYDGYERIAEPHAYGISTANHEVVSAYLVGGWSASEGAPGWRKYLVGDMHDVHALAETFEAPRPGYNPEDRQMRQVFCRLEAVSRPAAEAPRPESRA
jgi:hypothetical protein